MDKTQTYLKENNMQDQDFDIDEAGLIKKQIRQVKEDSLSATRKAVSKITHTEKVASSTLNSLARQSDKISKVERELDVADAQTDKANKQAKELKRINNSMFSFIKNPFKSHSTKKESLKIDQLKQRNKEVLEAKTSSNAQGDGLKIENQTLNLKNNMTNSNKKHNTNGKYNFEEDEEGLEIEHEINTNLDDVSSALGRLKQMSMNMNKELDTQNDQLNRIRNQTDNVEQKISSGKNLLNKID